MVSKIIGRSYFSIATAMLSFANISYLQSAEECSIIRYGIVDGKNYGIIMSGADQRKLLCVNAPWLIDGLSRYLGEECDRVVSAFTKVLGEGEIVFIEESGMNASVVRLRKELMLKERALDGFLSILRAVFWDALTFARGRGDETDLSIDWEERGRAVDAEQGLWDEDRPADARDLATQEAIELRASCPNVFADGIVRTLDAVVRGDPLPEGWGGFADQYVSIEFEDAPEGTFIGDAKKFRSGKEYSVTKRTVMRLFRSAIISCHTKTSALK